MSWLELKLRTTSHEAHALEDVLIDLGAVSVTLTDAEDQPLFEPPPGETPLWQQVVVTALFDESFIDDTAAAALLQALSQVWHPRPLPPLQHGILADQDWVRAWLDDFKPMRFGQHLWVCPSWFQPHTSNIPVQQWQPDAEQMSYWVNRNQQLLAAMQAPDNTVLLLDPGLAFGTGTHPTTSLCLQWLDARRPVGLELLDYGCGSGILGIAALLLGAHTVHGIDNDPQALLATADNCHKNGLDSARFPAHLPEDFQQLILHGDAKPADGIMANILAGTLIQLAGLMAAQVKRGGWLLLSGILREQADDVIARYQQWFSDFDVAHEGDWVRIAATRI
ncbi:MAG TPA: 50S ribosomal protein L11 methyltransferase [Candidatus Acidoferrum sp.]|nr:50S ribosomal protein L11 methyltransferase [Candidatus Acidoferrum sp.]